MIQLLRDWLILVDRAKSSITKGCQTNKWMQTVRKHTVKPFSPGPWEMRRQIFAVFGSFVHRIAANWPFSKLVQKVLPALKCYMWHGKNATLMLHATLFLFKSTSLGGTRFFHRYPNRLSKRRTRQSSIPPGTELAWSNRQDSSHLVSWRQDLSEYRSIYPAKYGSHMASNTKRRHEVQMKEKVKVYI